MLQSVMYFIIYCKACRLEYIQLDREDRIRGRNINVSVYQYQVVGFYYLYNFLTEYVAFRL